MTIRIRPLLLAGVAVATLAVAVSMAKADTAPVKPFDTTPVSEASPTPTDTPTDTPSDIPAPTDTPTATSSPVAATTAPVAPTPPPALAATPVVSPNPTPTMNANTDTTVLGGTGQIRISCTYDHGGGYVVTIGVIVSQANPVCPATEPK